MALSASLSAPGGLVAAFTESIGTFQSDCSTPKTSFNLGDPVCAEVTGASGQRRIVWVAPSGDVAQISAFFSGSGTDSYTIQTTGSFAQVGTWSVVSIDNSGAGFAAAQFVVHDPNLANADLAVSIFGPSQVSPGSNATYVMEVDNHGPDAAQGVTLTVPVPANTTFVSSDCASLTGTTCAIGSLNAGGKASVQYVFNVSNGATPGTFIASTAAVSSSTRDPFSSNNTTTYSAPVVVTNPGCTISCPGNISVNNDPNAANPCVAVVNYPTPTTSGNCVDPETGQTPPVVCSPPSGTAFPVGTTTVVCSSGGTSCSFTVTVNETRPAVQPTITCPSDVTVGETTPGSGSAIVNYPAPTTTGNCVTVVCNPPSGSSFPLGPTTVNCTGTDSLGTSVSCSFRVTVTSGNCSIICPGDLTATAAAGQCSAVVTFANPTTSGSCGTVTCNPPSGSTFPVGATPVICSATAGASCGFTVTVVPAVAPTITTCASNKTVSVDANCLAAIPNMVGEVVTTGCSVTVSQSPAGGSIVGPGTYTVIITAENAAGFATCTTTVIVGPPPVVTITAPASGSIFPVNTAINLTGSFTDANVGTHTATWTIGATTVTGTVNESTGAVTATFTPTTAGVFFVTLTVTDTCGLSGTANTVGGLGAIIVVFDPNAGFVTGGGWINSPAGALVANPSQTGKANFGFNAKYQHGSTTPTGQTEFQFHDGNFNFHATGLTYLVITPPSGQFSGTGTVNGSGNFGFTVTVIDGSQSGGGGVDKFRIKVWDKNSGNAVVYDTQMGAPDTADPTTTLGGGSIHIHN